jgi:hypothetical protein
MTPHKKAMGLKPDMRDVHAWGMPVDVQVEGRGKLKAQADPAFFVRYNGHSKGYHIYWPNKWVVTCECNIQWSNCSSVLLEGETSNSGNQSGPHKYIQLRLETLEDPMPETPPETPQDPVCYDSAEL